MGELVKTIWFYIYMTFLLCLILSSGGYVIYKMYIDNIGICSKNPLVYASNKWERDYGKPLEGAATFIDARGFQFTVKFNSTDAIIVNPISEDYEPLSSQEVEKLLSNYSKSK